MQLTYLYRDLTGLAVVTLMLGCQSGLATGPGGPDNSPESQISGDGGVRADLDGAGPDGDAPSPFANRERFEAEVAGPLTDECGVCHLDETPAFMAGPDLYDAVMAWPGLVTPGAPSLSSILTTGVHTGPAFTPAAVTAVFRWIVGAQDNPDVDAGTPVGVGEGLPGAPTAVFEAEEDPDNDLRWRFDARASQATEGVIAEYRWRWGDGDIGDGPEAVHTYPDDGTYAVQLTVVDDQDRRTTTTQIIAVGNGQGDRVVGFTLVNGNNGNDIGPLRNGDEIELNQTPVFTIRADTQPVNVGSVRFALDGDPDYHIENTEPYELNDNRSDLEPGVYRLSAQAYSNGNGNGVPGGSLTISFTVR